MEIQNDACLHGPVMQYDKKSDLQEPDVQPLQDVRTIELSVRGSHRGLQDSGQVVLVQRGGSAGQLRPDTPHTDVLEKKKSSL